MAITIKKEHERNPAIFFKELGIGDPFLYHDIVHIKACLLHPDDPDETEYITAINLNTGKENYFDPHDTVIPIKATLTYSIEEQD